MLEIIGLVFLTMKNVRIVKEKGRNGTGYAVLTVVLWIGFEFIGGFIGFLLTEEYLVAYLFAIIGAALGAFLSYIIAKNASPLQKEMNPPYMSPIVDNEPTEVQYADEGTKVEAIPRTKGYLIDKSAGKTYTLSNINVIGRGSLQEGEGNKIRLSDSYVSRIHTRMMFDGNRFKISDSSSKSGTYVNDQKIKGWVTLEDGDEIKVGRTYLKFTQSK